MKNFFLSASVATALGLVFSSGALAQSTTVKFGWVNVAPNSDASAVSGPMTPVNALSLKVQDQSTLYFGASREINDTWEVELAMGVPPTHDVAITVLNPNLPQIVPFDGQIGAKVRQVAPTLFVNYRFGDKGSKLRPFVGAGLNYTVFDKADSTAANDQVNGGPTTLKLEDSVGLAFQMGVTAKLGGPWSITGSWTTAQVKTKLTTNTLGLIRTADITFHPSVFTVALGYTF